MRGIMMWKVMSAATLAALLCCIHAAPDWYTHQDRSIKMPAFDATTKLDMVIDGATLQALRVAADDFLPPSSRPYSCAYTQSAQQYRVSHGDDIIFVYIGTDPAACGGQGYSLDGGVRYAISRDGRILRRILDGEGEDIMPDGGAVYRPMPDGGMLFLDPNVSIDYRYIPPSWMLPDGGFHVGPAAGSSSGQKGEGSTPGTAEGSAPGSSLPPREQPASGPLPGQMRSPCPIPYMEDGGGCWDEILVRTPEGMPKACPNTPYNREVKGADGHTRCFSAAMATEAPGAHQDR